eukprot:747751-Hanusia_phi.AAC.5
MPYCFKTLHAQEIEAKLESKFLKWKEWKIWQISLKVRQLGEVVDVDACRDRRGMSELLPRDRQDDAVDVTNVLMGRATLNSLPSFAVQMT